MTILKVSTNPNYFASQNWNQPASWSSCNAFVSKAEGLRFKSLGGQIERSVANGLPPLRHFFKRAVLPGRNDAEMGLTNSLHALAYYSRTAIIMKDLI